MLDALLPVVSFAFVATFSPGGATALATNSGAQYGLFKTIPLIGGIAVGLASLVAIALTGLATILTAIPAFAFVVKLLGTVYLVILAWIIAKAGPPPMGTKAVGRPIGFLGGLGLLLLNPKAWAMSTSLASNTYQQMQSVWVTASLFSAIFFICAIVSLTSWAVLGSFLARKLREAWHWHVVNGVLTVLLLISVLSFWVEV